MMLCTLAQMGGAEIEVRDGGKRGERASRVLMRLDDIAAIICADSSEMAKEEWNNSSTSTGNRQQPSSSRCKHAEEAQHERTGDPRSCRHGEEAQHERTREHPARLR